MKTALLVVMLVACSSKKERRSNDKQPPPIADPQAARAAAAARQYKRCAELWLAVADSTKGEAMAVPLYNAACCYAQDHQADAAFATLDRAVAAGFHELQYERDPDLASLHADPRWPKLHDTITAAIAQAEAAITEPALRRELLALSAEDQDARATTGDDLAVDQAIEVVDAKTTARMKDIIARYGWPGRSMVGREGAHAAWLLVQHSRDVAFQKTCLEKLELAVTSGEAQAVEHAYLYDRVAINTGKPQRYGTQFQGETPFPIEDESHVDERRKVLGLPTMAETIQQLHEAE